MANENLASWFRKPLVTTDRVVHHLRGVENMGLTEKLRELVAATPSDEALAHELDAYVVVAAEVRRQVAAA